MISDNPPKVNEFLTIASSVTGCDYKFGLFPKGEGCQTSYIKCDHGTPTEVRHTLPSDL